MRVVLYALCVHIIIHTTFAATICSCLYFCYFYFCVYLHVQVQAVSKWGSSLTGVGTYGEWANVTVSPDFPTELFASGGVCTCILFRHACVCVSRHACLIL